MADKAAFPLDGTKGAVRLAAIAGGALCMLICGAAALYALLSCLTAPFIYEGGWELLFLFLPVSALAIWFAGFFALTLVQMHTRAAVSEEGVMLMRPLQKARLIRWDEFQQVCICFSSSVPRGPSSPVVCFVRHGEKKNVYDRWRTDMPWHYRRLIVADHTEAIEAAVRNVCPMEVKDLRGTIAYPQPEK